MIRPTARPECCALARVAVADPGSSALASRMPRWPRQPACEAAIEDSNCTDLARTPHHWPLTNKAGNIVIMARDRPRAVTILSSQQRAKCQRNTEYIGLRGMSSPLRSYVSSGMIVQGLPSPISDSTACNSIRTAIGTLYRIDSVVKPHDKWRKDRSRLREARSQTRTHTNTHKPTQRQQKDSS